MRIKRLTLNLLLVFISISCSAINADTISIFYTRNTSLINIMDSISDLNKRDKKDYQKQEFLMLLRQSEKGIMLYITQCYIDKDTFKDYHPLGCVIKNDSYFYIVNQGISNDSLNSIFKKTDNKIIPYIMKEQDIDADVYFVYRESRLFRLINGFFRRE